MGFVKAHWKLLAIISVAGAGIGYGIYRLVRSKRVKLELAEQRKAA